jgi:hypothetical protein
MTFFFSLENLEKESCNNSVEFIEILETAFYKKLPSKRKKVRAIKRDLRGNSFILKLEPILQLKRSIDTAYLVQYVKLCGMRDYNMYKLYGIKTLPLSYYPDIDLNAIKHNPLLKITQTEIYFKYE